ncbi:beta-lactamase family protein [OCS116 cluster bacterium]|nr:beta-lactamase family protein [OCS116 cluster bacterium]
MTLNYSYGNDIIVTTSSDTYRGLSGDDIYIISKGLTPNSDINIIDTDGNNSIQLIDEINLKQIKISNDALQITIANNAKITINGANTFKFELSGNVTNGRKGILYNFDELINLLTQKKNTTEDIISISGSYIVNNGNLSLNENIFSWNITSPETLGIELTKVQKLIEYIKEPSLNTQAAILIQSNNIIAEYYAEGYNKNDLVTSWSVAKSFSSTLIGIAIDEGYIGSVDDSISLYLPEWKTEPQENISLKYLLGMRSGMDDHPGLGVYFQNDMVNYSLDREISREPGIAFSYSNEDSMLFSRIIENATSFDFQEYADTRLFDKLDIKETWWTDKSGNTLTYAGLDMTPREFAKFGLMIAQEGKWLDEQIVSESWIGEATTEFDNLASYGYQWWTSTISESGLGMFRQDDYPFFSALGLDGQYIYVWPEKDLVLVRFTKYQHQGNIESSVVDIGAGTYHGTESGNMIITKLEDLFYAIGNNLEDQITPTYSDFG